MGYTLYRIIYTLHKSSINEKIAPFKLSVYSLPDPIYCKLKKNLSDHTEFANPNLFRDETDTNSEKADVTNLSSK